MHYHAFCTESAQIPLLSFTLKPFCYLIFAWLNWARSLFILVCLRQMKTFSSFAGASIGVALTLEFELQTSHSTSYLHYATFPCELISPAPEISTIRWPIQHINIQSIIFSSGAFEFRSSSEEESLTEFRRAINPVSRGSLGRKEVLQQLWGTFRLQDSALLASNRGESISVTWYVLFC